MNAFLLLAKIAKIYAFIVCKICGPKIRSCKIVEQKYVWARPKFENCGLITFWNSALILLATRVLLASPKAKHGQNGSAATFCQQ